MQTWDSLPPKSTAICSMAGLLQCAFQRICLFACGVRIHHRVASGASHFIQSLLAKVPAQVVWAQLRGALASNVACEGACPVVWARPRGPSSATLLTKVPVQAV